MRSLDSSISFLLVEDDTTNIQNIQSAFAANNITNKLTIAQNGVEAFDKLHGRNGEEKLVPTPKIVLLDINMPKMDGLEFLKLIRQDPELSSLLVFMLTSSDSDRDQRAAYNHHVAGYILKPTELEEFIRIIAALHDYWKLLAFPT